MAQLSEPAPVPGRVEWLAPGLRRLLAPNPSPMTFHGTNTYIVGSGTLAVIDPGPDDPAHLSAMLAAVGEPGRISHILVTHAHLDHAPLARALSAASGAPVLAFGDAAAGRSAQMRALAESGQGGGGEGVDHGFAPDIRLADGDWVDGDGWRLQAIHTPGHFAGHLSFLWGQAVFSGDHVMGWSSSLVSPPDGDMGAYLRSLDRLMALAPARLYPGHGAPVDAPGQRITFLARHRRNREAEILAALNRGPADAATLARAIYTDTPKALLPAAARNVFAHLIDLAERDLITCSGPLASGARFTGR